MSNSIEKSFFQPPSQSNIGNNLPQQSNYASGQELGPLKKSVYQSHTTRKATGVIIKTRGDLKKYLQSNGLDLVTSAIEFQKSGSFLSSSYIVYPNNMNQKEPLRSFVSRYSQFQEAIAKIELELKPFQNQMQVGGGNF